MQDILIVVDMQNDFVEGSLGQADALSLVERIVKRVEKHAGPVLFTQDTHSEDYLETQEGKRLPVEHCLRGTAGWQLVDPLLPHVKVPAFEKGQFGSVELCQYLVCQHHAEAIERITLVGLVTDICVLSNAILIKAFLPEVTVVVDADLTLGTSKEARLTALLALANCQVEIQGRLHA